MSYCDVLFKTLLRFRSFEESDVSSPLTVYLKHYFVLDFFIELPFQLRSERILPNLLGD